MSFDQTSSAAPELAKLRARSNLLLALYTHVAHDFGQTQHECDRLQGDLARARSELGQNAERIASMESQLRQTAEHIARMETELGQGATRIVRMEIELGQSAARVIELEQRLAAMRSSTSWRVSAPIRAIGRLFKEAP